MKHAKMLLMYQVYLLYNFKFKLESAEAFKAVNYFLKRIKRTKQKISNKFFVKVEAHVDRDWLDYYNEFAKLYLEMGFKIRKFETLINENLLENDTKINK